MSKTYRQGTLEAKIDSFIPNGKNYFRLIVHSLIRGENGWEVNDSHYHGKYDREELLTEIRGRWETYKRNYLTSKEAIVSEICDDASFDKTICLEINCQSFVDIEILD